MRNVRNERRLHVVVPSHGMYQVPLVGGLYVLWWELKSIVGNMCVPTGHRRSCSQNSRDPAVTDVYELGNTVLSLRE